MSQSELAVLLGCGDPLIAGMEAGLHEFSIGDLTEIAAGLYTPIYVLIDDELEEWMQDRHLYAMAASSAIHSSREHKVRRQSLQQKRGILEMAPPRQALGE